MDDGRREVQMMDSGTMVGRYRVLHRLGEGGMGVVYAAYDTDLDRPVALKFPAQDIESGSDWEERLRQEARAASALDHNNICTIHEIGETAEGRTFIAMALYEGTTIKELLAQGPLSPDRARDVAIQVARGLAHAHRAGIIHRDIKPANLLLTNTGVVKILDFGIAKRQGQGLPRTSGGPGTTAYMSPEQLGGEALDGRADIWSLGAVLYEMLTGEQPFAAPEPAAVMYRILNSWPHELRGRRSSLPADLRRVLIRCLAKDPSARYGSAEDLLKELKPLHENRLHRLRRFARTHPVMSAAVAVTLVLVPAGLTSSPSQRWIGSFVSSILRAAPRYVAVLPFSSPDSVDAVLAAGLTQYFTQLVEELAATNDTIWVLPHGDLIGSELSTPADVRRIYPVDLVVTGELRRTGPDVVLQLEVLDVRPDRPRLVSSLEIRDPADSLSSFATEALLVEVLELPGLADSAEHQDRQVQETSPAQRYYQLGVGQLLRTYDEASLSAAVDLFETAIAADSTFGRAYAGLCEALWETYIGTGDASNADEARAMCDRGYELSRSDPVALVAVGRTQLFTGQLPQAELTLREAIERGAGAGAHRWLGHVLEQQGNLEAAEREYLEAIAQRQDIWVYYSDLGMMFTNAGLHEEASEWHREVIRLSPENPQGYSDLGASQMFLNHLDEAEALFRRSIATKPTSFAYRNLGYLYLRDRRYEQAVGSLQSGIGFNSGDWWSWRWLAHAQHWRGDGQAARNAWLRVVELIEPRLAVNPTDRDLLCGLAEALVALGDADTAQRHLDFLASLELTRNYNTYWIGRTFEMLGSRRAALQYIHRALDSGFDSTSVMNDPWLDDLRSDPEYRGPR